MYIIARTRSNRPSLMHRLNVVDTSWTACGISLFGWSRAYFKVAVPEVLCKKCGRVTEKEGY